MAGKPGKKPIKPIKKLTEKQQAFIENLMNEGSETFADVVKSMQTAGYKHGREPRATAIGLLANRNILNGLLQKTYELKKTSIIRQESAKERIWQELEEALSDCKTGGDMTNRIRVIELMGKYHQLWSDKITVSVETMRELDAERQLAVADIARLTLLQSNPVDAQFVVTDPLQGNSEPVALPEHTLQVGDCIDDNSHNSTENDKPIIDNDLQNQ